MRQIIDLTGQRFGRLTVIKRIENDKNNNIRWLCKCDCDGNEKEYLGNNLKYGKTKSCGCLYKEIMKKQNIYDLTGEFGIGYTTKGEEFYFDLEDYDKIKDYCWSIDKRGYVNSYRRKFLLHRIVMNLKNDEEVDHINRNPNDNRKENLRLCNRSQNMSNRGIPKNNSSGIIGVFWESSVNKWTAHITVNRKRMKIGRFCDKEEAIKTRLKAEKEYFGEFAPQKYLFEQYNI